MSAMPENAEEAKVGRRGDTTLFEPACLCAFLPSLVMGARRSGRSGRKEGADTGGQRTLAPMSYDQLPHGCVGAILGVACRIRLHGLEVGVESEC